MDRVPYSKARQNLATVIDRACRNHEPVIITRNQKSVVLMSLEDYNALEETAYLLRSPRNALRLLHAIKQLETGMGSEGTGEEE